jgi:hypothetical protein
MCAMSKHHPLDVRYSGGASAPLPPSLRKRPEGEEKPAATPGLPRVPRNEGPTPPAPAQAVARAQVTAADTRIADAPGRSGFPIRRLLFLIVIGVAAYSAFNAQITASRFPAADLTPEEIKAAQKP